jgi:hypothetical protein
LRGFARRQNIEISRSRFETDIERLTHALASILESLGPRQVDRTEGALLADRKSEGSDKVKLTHISPEPEETPPERVAADGGDAPAQNNIGWFYQNGL